MNIVYTSSDLYSRVGAVSIASLLENNKDAENIKIFYIHNHMKKENQDLISRMVERYEREVVFIQMPDLSTYASGLVRTNIIVYSYCFLHEILPVSVDKVLLIECDTLVMKPLKELWETDIDHCYLAAADDIKSVWYKKALNMHRESKYINSGVMLINVKKWRHSHVTQKMSKLLTSGTAKCFYEVQDELNVLFEGNIHILPPKFNCTTALFLFGYKNMVRYRKPESCFSLKAYNEAVTQPVIVHFTTNQIMQSRPWIENCEHPYREKYLEIKKHTEVQNDVLWESKKKFRNKVANFIYRHFPKCITASVVGCAQAYLFPMKEYVKRKLLKKNVR